MKRIFKIFIFIFIILSFFYINDIKVKAAYNESSIGTYEQELACFPNSYRAKIEALHNTYPNAIFVAQDTFFDWESYTEVTVDWTRMLLSEYYESGVSSLSYVQRARSLIEEGYPDGYRSNASWAYNYYNNSYQKFDTGRWYAAGKDTIAYYMDPRNFLDSKYVFMFESNLYHDYQSLEGVQRIISNTFMANKTCPGSDKSYAEVILESARTNDISAYMLASRLKQEQGTSGTSSLISGTYSGYNGYYNYFNVKASGNSNTEVIVNGLNYAKNQGWDSPYKSIIGGASFIKTEYVGINDKYNAKGQLTGYLQKWDPYGYKLGGHQYMQNITAHYSEATSTYNSYSSTTGYNDFKYIFYIPVYTNMPSSTSLPNPGNPNNWLSNLTVNGATVSGFNRSDTSYSYNVSNSTDSVYVDYTKVANTSSVSGAGTITLTGDKTNIEVLVTAQNGDKKIYKITINRDAQAKLSVSEIINSAGIKTDGTYLSGLKIKMSAESLKSKITSVASSNLTINNSLGTIKTGTLCTGDSIAISSGLENKTYNIIIYGDVNGDGEIKASDYVFIKNYIMGTKYLSGAYLKAADVNKDGKVTAGDYVLIKNNIMGTYTISQ